MGMPQRRITSLPPGSAGSASSKMMDLSPSLQIDVDQVIGQQVLAAGVQGSGKTNFGVLFVEQLAQYSVPLVIFDKESDWESAVDVFPRGVLATRDNCPSGQDVLDHGLQVVYALSSWDDEDERARLICSVVSQLISWAECQPMNERVPCLIVLDEASYWLPQRRGTSLSVDSYKQLAEAFKNVSSIGRKRGLTPMYLTQKISQTSKAVLNPGIFAFFRTGLKNDLNAYLEYIHSELTAKQMKARIAAFSDGKAIVLLPGGQQKIVTFHRRKSEHISHTPKSQAALNKYAGMPFDKSQRYGTPVIAPEQAVYTPEPEPVHVYPVKPVSAYQQCEILLKKNLLLTAEELHQMTGGTIGLDTITNYRRMLVAHLRNSYGAIHARVLAVLQVDAEISDTDLAQHANCTLDQARLHRGK